MMKNLFVLAPCAMAEITSLRLPNTFDWLPRIDLNGGMSREKQTISGGYTTCFLSTLTLQGKNYTLMIDTGSSDTTLAHTSLNDFSGDTISYSIPSGSENDYNGLYGDGSWWNGYLVRLETGLVGTSITAIAPIMLMTSQSTSPIFADGVTTDGLFGVAFEALSGASSSPKTVMDAWYNAGVLSKNQLAFHGCPYNKEADSWIDIGNDTPYTACGYPTPVKIKIPVASYVNFQLTSVLVGGTETSPGTPWQSGGYSFLDSCTSNILLPTPVLNELVNQIKTGPGLSNNLKNSAYLTGWLGGTLTLKFSSTNIIWDLMPTLNFTIPSGYSEYSHVSLTLSARQYIQRSNDGWWYFMVRDFGATTNAILGLPLFQSYHIVIDRSNLWFSVQPGCGCDTALDAYPLIEMRGIVTSSTTSLSQSSSTRSSVSSTISTQGSTSSANLAQGSTTSSTISTRGLTTFSTNLAQGSTTSSTIPAQESTTSSTNLAQGSTTSSTIPAQGSTSGTANSSSSTTQTSGSVAFSLPLSSTYYSTSLSRPAVGNFTDALSSTLTKLTIDSSSIPCRAILSNLFQILLLTMIL